MACPGNLGERGTSPQQPLAFDCDPSFNSNGRLTALFLQLLHGALQRGRFYSTLQERQQLQVSEGLREVLSRTQGLPMRGDLQQEKPLPGM